MVFLGKDDGPAAHTAHRAGVEHDPVSGAATLMIERLMDVGIDGAGPFSSARGVAELALREHLDVEPAVDALVRSHLRLAAANGFVTSLGGFVVLPIALPANVIGFYLVATRMVAGIASTRGHDISRPDVRSAVLLSLVGADTGDLLRRASDAGSGKMFNLAAQRMPGPVLIAVRKGVVFRVLSRVGKRAAARFGKAVPVAGGFVGAGFDAYLLRQIANHARLEFPWRAGPVPEMSGYRRD